MAAPIDPREVSVTVVEDDLRHDSESTHHSRDPTLSIYNIPLPTAPPTADSSAAHSAPPTPRTDDEKTADSTSLPATPLLCSTPPRPSTPPTRPPPPLLSSLRGPRALPPHPLELHSPPPSSSPPRRHPTTSSPPKSHPPSPPHSTSSVFPTFSSPAPTTPSTRARLLDHRVAELDRVQQTQGRCVLLGAGAILLLFLLTTTALVGGVYYLTHRIPPPLSPASVTSLQLADGAVTAAKLAAGAVTLPTLTPSLSSLFLSLNLTYQQALGLLPIAGTGLTQNLSTHSLSLHLAPPLTITPLNQLSVAASSLTSQYIAGDAITPTQLAPAAVTADALAAGAVGWAALGLDVVGWLEGVNATAEAAWEARVQAGAGVTVQGGVVGVDYDPALFAVNATTDALTLAPLSITSALISPYSIPLSSLAPDFLSLIPTPGPGLTLTNSSLTLNFDPSTFTLTPLNALTLAPSSITTTLLAPYSVTLSALDTDVLTLLAAIANSSSTALSTTQGLLLTQSYLATQLLSALNSSEAGLLQEVGNATNALWQAVTAVNASTTTAVAALNSSSLSLLFSLAAAVTSLSTSVTATAAAFAAQIPVAGAGLSQTGTVLSLVVDPSLFAYPAGTLTLAPLAITSAYLQPGAVNATAIAAGAVGAAQLAAGAVTAGKLAAPLQAVMAVLNPGVTGVGGGLVSVGGGVNASVITRPPGGDLLVQGATNGTVWLQAGGAKLAVSDAGVGVNTSTFAVTATNVSVQAASTLTAAASDLLLSSAAASLELSSTGAAMTASGLMSVTATSLALNASSSITLAASNVTVTGSVQFKPVSLTVTGSTFSFDFSALPSTVVRLTGNVGASNLTFAGCGEGTAGTVLTVYNQLRSGVLHLPPGTCGNWFDVQLQAGQRVTVTCAGLVGGVAAVDCQRSELPQGGLTVQSSAGLIVNNTVSGVVNGVTAKGSVTLQFTPTTNVVSLSFILDNPLLTVQGAAGAVMLSPVASGTVNAEYSDAKQSPLWVCVKQRLAGQQLTVTLVNVGDALYVNQTQQLQFAYQVL